MSELRCGQCGTRILPNEKICPVCQTRVSFLPNTQSLPKVTTIKIGKKLDKEYIYDDSFEEQYADEDVDSNGNTFSRKDKIVTLIFIMIVITLFFY